MDDADAQRIPTQLGAGQLMWRRWGDRRDRPPLVLLHGQSGSWRHWTRTIGHFAATRQVWAPDLPGMGDSADAPPPGDLPAVAQATLEGLLALPIHGCPLDLAGFSFGGIVGARVAASGRVRVRHFVVVGSTGLGLPLPPLRLLPWRDEPDSGRRRALHRANLETLLLTPAGARDAEALAVYTHDLARDRYRGPPVGSGTLLLDALADIPAPVGGIWGAHDALVQGQPSRARAAMRAVRPDLRFAVVPHAGHWAAFEQPAVFNALLEAMLDEPGPA